MRKRFRRCDLNQGLLLPPWLEDWLPEGHLARFVAEVVESLDLSAIYAEYEAGDGRGLAAYDPRMMVRVLIYGYCRGVASSRRIERATADAGYFSEGSVTDRSLEGSDLFIAPDKQKHREEVAVATGPPPPESSSVAERMRYKLRTPEGRAVYKMRRRWLNRCLDRSRNSEGSGGFCCAG